MLGLSDEMTKKIPNWAWWFILGLITAIPATWTVKGTLDRFEYLEIESQRYKKKADQDRKSIREELETLSIEVRKESEIETDKIREEIRQSKARSEYINERIGKKFDQAKEYTDLKTQ